MSEIASAYVSLLPSARGFGSKLNGAIGGDVDKAGKTSGSRFGSVFAKTAMGPLRVFGEAALGLFAVDKVKDFFASSIDEARESQKVGALTAQVIKSTGHAAGISAKQVGNLAGAISKKVGVDDEAIQSGENMLLTFKNIRNEAGAGNKIFDQASRTMTDMAASMAAASGGEVDFKSAAIQLGKALNDPVKGITALSRVGVTFDAQQQKTIKSLVASGKTMDAQKIILKELKSEFGGAAAAQATAGDKMSVAWGNLKEQVGTAVIPVLDKAEAAITTKVIPAVSKFVTEMQDGTGVGGEFVADLKQVGDVAKGIEKFLEALPGPVKSFGAEAAIAAAVLPRLSGAVNTMGGAFTLASAKLKQSYAEMTYATTRAQKLSAVTSNLGGVMRQAAGIGGMMLLMDGARRTSSAMSALETTAGGAATGFAVGGPWGAAIGGGIGLLTALKRANDESNSSFEDSSHVFSRYRDSLNQMNGAIQKQTLQTIRDNLQKNADTAGTSLDAISKLYGVPTRDQIQAIAGNVDAFKRIKDRLSQQVAGGTMDKTFASDFLNFVRQQRSEIERDGKSIRQNTSDISSWRKALSSLPKQAVTTLKQEGYDPSFKQLRSLQSQYGLTPKQVTTVLKATGTQISAAQAKQLKVQYDKVPHTVTTKAQFIAGGAAGQAKSYGQQVGGMFGAGYAAGIDRWIGAVQDKAAAMANAAHAAAMRAQQSHSPSRKAQKLGAWFTEGYANGLGDPRQMARVVAGGALLARQTSEAAANHGKHNKKAATVLTLTFVEGLKSGTPKIQHQADLISKMLGDKIANKKQRKKIKDALGGMTDAIRKQLDKQLDVAKSRVDAIKDKISAIGDTISSIKDTLAQTASSVAQNYLPQFTTNALFGPDGKLIAGTAVSSFMSQLKSQKSVLDSVMTAYKKLIGEGLNGDWLSGLLASGNNNLILDLASGSAASALSAQSIYQQVQTEANALGRAVASNTTAQSQLAVANQQKAVLDKQLAVANQQVAAAQRREDKLTSIDKQMKKLDKLETLDKDISKGLNKLIASANKGRKS